MLYGRSDTTKWKKKNQIYCHLAVKMTKMSKWEPLLCEDNGHAAIKVVAKVHIARTTERSFKAKHTHTQSTLMR